MSPIFQQKTTAGSNELDEGWMIEQIQKGISRERPYLQRGVLTISSRPDRRIGELSHATQQRNVFDALQAAGDHAHRDYHHHAIARHVDIQHYYHHHQIRNDSRAYAQGLQSSVWGSQHALQLSCLVMLARNPPNNRLA